MPVDPLVVVHVIAAAALVVAAAVVGAWGLVRARSIANPARRREGAAFTQLLQLSHSLVIATGLIGLFLLGDGHRPDDPLHARVYGPFMVIAILAAYGYRTDRAVTNVRVFAIVSLVILALGARALVTGG